MINEEDSINIDNVDVIDVKSNQILIHTFRLHESVGYDASCETSNEESVVLIEKRYTYRHPERMKDPHITGADEALGEFVFQTQKEGKAVITIHFEFRSEIERSHQIVINVK